MKRHHYQLSNLWTGNLGQGTSGYDAYSRDFEISIEGKAKLLGSSDPHFRGDGARWNPEDMLVAAVSSCHKLWYLHLAAVAGVNVESYEDKAEGEMIEGQNGGHFEKVTLRPKIKVSADSDVETAMRLHDEAHHYCFIANSVNFEIVIQAEIEKSGA